MKKYTDERELKEITYLSKLNYQFVDLPLLDVGHDCLGSIAVFQLDRRTLKDLILENSSLSLQLWSTTSYINYWLPLVIATSNLSSIRVWYRRTFRLTMNSWTWKSIISELQEICGLLHLQRVTPLPKWPCCHTGFPSYCLVNSTTALQSTSSPLE